jgi:hypothetical protein
LVRIYSYIHKTTICNLVNKGRGITFVHHDCFLLDESSKAALSDDHAAEEEEGGFFYFSAADSGIIGFCVPTRMLVTIPSTTQIPSGVPPTPLDARLDATTPVAATNIGRNSEQQQLCRILLFITRNAIQLHPIPSRGNQNT